MKGKEIAHEEIESMVRFIQNEVKKRGYEKAVLGLSGGVDSAVVALLCTKALGSSVKVLIMPAARSASSSMDDALELCEQFGIAHEVLPITRFEGAFEEMFKEADMIARGNFCARVRMAALYLRSHQEKRLVIGTSNKSELMLGYGTIYGDLACAINPIGGFFKTEIYEIARMIGVTQKIIDKTPSADLYEGQSDRLEIGYGYEEIDPLLMEYEMGIPPDELTGHYGKKMVNKIVGMIERNRFKCELPAVYIPTCPKGSKSCTQTP